MTWTLIVILAMLAWLGIGVLACFAGTTRIDDR